MKCGIVKLSHIRHADDRTGAMQTVLSPSYYLPDGDPELVAARDHLKRAVARYKRVLKETKEKHARQARLQSEGKVILIEVPDGDV